MAALRYEHVLATVVAVLIASTALWYGGNPPEITAAISVVTWWAIAIGVACGFLPATRLKKASIVPLALLLTLTVLTGLSFYWTKNEGLAFNSLVQMTGVLGLFLLALCCSRPGSAFAWLKGITAGFGFLVLLAAISRFIPGIGNDSEIAKTLYGSSGRLAWPLGYWNALAAIAAMGALMAAWFAATHPNARWRWLCVATLPTFFLVIYLTSSRAALVALVGGTALLFAMETRRKGLLIACCTGVVGGVILVLVVIPMHALVHADRSSAADWQGYGLMVATLLVTAVTYLFMRRYEGRLRARPVPRPSLSVWIALGVVVLLGLVLFNPIKQGKNFVATPNVTKATDASENQTTYHLLSAGGNGRWQYWSEAFGGFASKPFFGLGAGGYQDYYTNHRSTLIFGRDAHSLPLRFLSELGIVGFLIAAVFMGWILWVGWRRWRISLMGSTLNSGLGEGPFLAESFPPLAVLIATGMISMCLDWTSEFPVVAAPILIAMAALVGPATRNPAAAEAAAAETVPDATAETATKSHRTGLAGFFPPEIVAVLTVIVAGVGILFSTWGFGISHNVKLSQDALRDGNTNEGIAHAQDAVDLAPWSAGALTQLMNAQEADGQYGKALATSLRAIDQAPLNSTPWFARYRIGTYLQDNQLTLESAVQAKRIDPHAPFFALNPKILQGSTPVPPVVQ